MMCPGSDDEWCPIHGNEICTEVTPDNKLVGLIGPDGLIEQVNAEKRREQEIIADWYRASGRT